jgi:putative transposase
MARGNGKMCIFLDDGDYREFVYLLSDVLEDFKVECWNFCAMPNHFHATLQPSQPNLSTAIARLNSRYAQWWNRRHQRVGHVFQGRFKDQIVDHEKYLMSLSRYVVQNPVRAKLVNRPEDWAWSSYRATAGLDPTPSFLAATLTLRMFGEGQIAQQQARFVDAMAVSASDAAAFDRIRSKERILGSREFKDRIERAHKRKGTSELVISQVGSVNGASVTQDGFSAPE